jgi:tetratricopeptide (TPR) repeat protein
MRSDHSNPAQHRRYTYQAVTRLLLHESHAQPVVAVVEDLHWNDALTRGLLNELVVASQNARLLLIVTYRPEYRDEWRNRPNYRQLRLDPLVSEGFAELLQALLGPDPSLETLKSFLVERASGNPFFVEEIVRSLVDTGVLEGTRGSYRLARLFPSMEVPPTVRAVLAARIDALPTAEKRLLEEAAVIGHDVPFTLLLSICGLTEDRLRGLLDNLQAAEFLYATQLFPDLQYTFKHSLTHDVTYSGVLHERRRGIHAQVVDAVEQLYADRLSGQVERLAHHAMRGEKQEKAVHYLRQAGGKAAARSALSDARTWFEQALDVLKALPESRATLEQAFKIRLELRPVLRQLGEGQPMREHLREAEALAERLKDDRRLGEVCAFMTTVQSTLGELDDALATGTRALQIADRLGDLRLRIVATSHLEQVWCYRGGYENVVGLATDNLAALPTNWVHEYFGMAAPPSVAARAWLIMSLAELGRFAEATGMRRRRSDSPNQRNMRTRLVGPISARACSTSSRATGPRRFRGSSNGSRCCGLAMSPSNFPGRSPPALGPWRRWAKGARRGTGSGKVSSSSSIRWREGLSAIAAGPTARWVVLVCCSASSMRRGAWPIARSNPLGASLASRPMRSICSATSRPIPTGSIPKAG